VRDNVIELALDEPALSPRELAVVLPTARDILSQRRRSTAC
jgi:hypothetical protein